MVGVNNCHIQYASCLLIGVPLDAASCAIVTAAPSTVMAGMVEVTGTTNKVAGTDYSAKNFGGAKCGPTIKGPTEIQWLDMTGQMCLIDWGFMSATTGNPLVLDATGNTVGYQELLSAALDPCADNVVPKMALAIIRRAATGEGGCNAVTTAGSTTRVLHVFPNTTNWSWEHSGWNDTRDIRTFAAEGYGNPNIGAGPFNLWPATSVPNKVDPAAFHSEVFIAATGVPTPACDPVAHPAPAVRT